jgi:hypothetical protein
MQSNLRQLVPVSQPHRPVHGSYRTAARAVALGIAAVLLCLPALGNNRRPSPTPPSTPGNFHVTAVTTSSVSLAWNASTGGSGGQLGYNIVNVTTGFILNVGDVTSYTWDIGVQAGGTYSFYIEAYDGFEGTQVSAPSAQITVTLAGTPLPTPVQPAPPVVTATGVTSNTISVTWTEATPASEIGSYFISVNGIANASTNASTTAATLTGLWPGFSYQIAVIAYSLNGTTGALSTTGKAITVTTAASTATPPADAPTAPTDLTGDGDGGGEAIVSWNPSTSVNEPQADIQYVFYIDGVEDADDGTVGQTSNVYIFPRGAIEPSPVWVVAIDQFGNQSAPSNTLTIDDF